MALWGALAQMAELDLYLEKLLDTAERRLAPSSAAGGRAQLFLAGPQYSIVDALFAPIL